MEQSVFCAMNVFVIAQRKHFEKLTISLKIKKTREV